MITLQQIESDLRTAMKERNQVAVDALRGLKTRVQNEQIAKMKELGEEDLVMLVRSEIKKRKEAAESFLSGGRTEQAEKENQEASIFEKYLPPQLSEEELSKMADEIIAENNFAAKDFGVAMGKMKAKAGSSADGGTLAKVLKEKLK